MNNPKAFPALCSDHSCDPGGMSLRDWFAGQALAGMSEPKFYIGRDETNQSLKTYARNAYTVADAMLAAREGK